MKPIMAILLAAGFVAGAAHADTIRVGVVASQTGPGASLGIPEAKSIALLPTKIGTDDVEWIVLDDATDSTKAVADMRKLISDNQVDAIVGSTVTPASLAMLEVAAEQKVPMISMAASSAIVEPMDDKRHWVFKTAQNDALMASAIADHMAATKIKTIGIIAFSDSYGDGWIKVISPMLAAKGIKVLDEERYARADTSVTGQMLKLVAAKPDAVFIISAGTPAVLPAKALKDRGYKGAVYQTHGVANLDFLRVGGKDVEGEIMPVGPIVVVDQLPASHPSKAPGLAYKKAYEAANGAGSVSAFGSYAADAGALLEAAIPVARKTAKPGTPEFRAALRDALEGIHGLPAVNGVVTMSPTDHIGQDARARVLVTIKDGGWKYLGN
jgi:branched-chain amino acid transport system substrate-binding protein